MISFIELRSLIIWTSPSMFYAIMFLGWMYSNKSAFLILVIFSVRCAKWACNLFYFLFLGRLCYAISHPNHDDLSDIVFIFKLYFSFATIGHFHNVIVVPIFSPIKAEVESKDVLVFVRKDGVPVDFKIQECTICLSEFTDNDRTRKLLCGHTFHEDCLRSHILYNHQGVEYRLGPADAISIFVLFSTCPLCSGIFPCFRTTKDRISESF